MEKNARCHTGRGKTWRLPPTLPPPSTTFHQVCFLSPRTPLAPAGAPGGGLGGPPAPPRGKSNLPRGGRRTDPTQSGSTGAPGSDPALLLPPLWEIYQAAGAGRPTRCSIARDDPASGGSNKDQRSIGIYIELHGSLKSNFGSLQLQLPRSKAVLNAAEKPPRLNSQRKRLVSTKLQLRTRSIAVSAANASASRPRAMRGSQAGFTWGSVTSTIFHPSIRDGAEGRTRSRSSGDGRRIWATGFVR